MREAPRIYPAPAGASSIPISPLRRQPIRRNQVVGGPHRRKLARRRDPMAPSNEPSSRGAGIDPAPGHMMLPAVEQNVDQTIPHLAGRPQRAAVEAIGPNSASASDPTVDRLREADAEPLHPARQCGCPVGLDEQVQVVRLHREMHDAEVCGRREHEPAADRAEDAVSAQRRKAAHGPNRHVDGMAVIARDI
ncbi:MAG TPA: hypothetical protein VKU61_07305 [Candidatus Binatia bacterium]|nr:hypothetical protein [Candidatus Binatia bacterium]